MQELQQLSAPDRDRIDILQNLRKHNQLLERYFNLLWELATSNAQDQTYREIESVVQNLNTIGNKLRGSNLVQNKGVLRYV